MALLFVIGKAEGDLPVLMLKNIFLTNDTAIQVYCGALSKTKYIGSKYLIEILNDKFSGQTITSEQATVLLAIHLKTTYECKAI